MHAVRAAVILTVLALATAEAYAADSQVAALKQSAADMILQQDKPYRE